MNLSLIFASDPNGVIGKDQQLPWHIPADMKLFKAFTLHHALIMGRKTFETHSRPLPHRLNIVLSSQSPPPHLKDENVKWVNSWEKAIEIAKEWAKDQRQSEIFVIGGGEIFKQVFSLPFPLRIYWTKILQPYDGNVFFPLDYLHDFTEKKIHFTYHKEYNTPPIFEFYLLEKKKN